MGAINYGCSDIINIGANLPAYDCVDEEDRECGLAADLEIIHDILDKHSFDHFKVNIESGYYEGFFLRIEDPEYLYFDDKAEKRDFIKELTQLKRCLLECVYFGMVQYIPGWCTGYSSERETVLAIRAAIRDAKAKAEKAPCYRTYERMKNK